MLQDFSQGEPPSWLGFNMAENRDGESVSPLVGMQIAQAVTNAKVEEVGRLVTELRTEVRELKSTFVTKSELEPIHSKLKKLEDWNTWIGRALVTLFLSAIASIIYVKGGVPHP